MKNIYYFVIIVILNNKHVVKSLVKYLGRRLSRLMKEYYKNKKLNS